MLKDASVSKLSFGQIAFQVGTSHRKGFAEILSRMPTEQCNTF